MVDRLFPILGGVVPPMLGREAIMERLMASLTKPTPDHLQVVGPRFAGKTVILHDLARRLRKPGTPYSAVFLWDLGHQTPATDELFMQRFALELASVLAQDHRDYADHLKTAQGNPKSEITEVLDALKGDGKRVLAIMDGFDKPLSNGHLTRNLWDDLLALASKPSLRFVTASRRTLHSLIRQPDAQTSDFWGVFDPSPVRVGCFDAQDLDAILRQISGLQLTGGAKTELWNATNGFPVLLLEVLNAVCNAVRCGDVEADTVVNTHDKVLPALDATIEALWRDCSPSSQDLMRRVVKEQSVSPCGIATSDANTLIERGFVHQSGNKLQRPNRLLSKFLDGRPNEGNALVRLFGNADAYMQHLKGVMERRILHLTGIDPKLKRYLERGAEDLQEHPDLFLSNIRGIVDQAFELIWKAELEEKRLPSGWMSEWKYNNEGGVRDDWQINFPQGGHRVRLLNLMTGTDKSRARAKRVTKSTYVLMNAAHSFGDFGQHREGVVVDSGTAYSALLLCIELAASVTRELALAEH